MLLLEAEPVLAGPCGGDCNTCPTAGSCPDRVVCKCLKIVEETVISAIRLHGARSVCELKAITGAGDGCMCCHKELKSYLRIYASSSSPSMCWAR